MGESMRKGGKERDALALYGQREREDEMEEGQSVGGLAIDGLRSIRCN
jgi:hypothetical protein